MTLKDIAYIWLSITIVFASILVAWLFARWFDLVMLHVSLGAIFGMIATLPIWLLFKAVYGGSVAPQTPVERCNGEWRVIK